MFDPSEQMKKIIKPLLIALVLIFVVAVFSRSSEENSVSLDLCFSDDSIPQSIFSSPVQKSKPELPQLLLEQNDSFRATSPPFSINPQTLGALVEGNSFKDTQRKVITEYEVDTGDNISSIAGKFNITVSTLLWANELSARSIIRPGQKLIVPPISGVIHHVSSGDTVGGIAERYDIKSSEIISFNQLSGEADIYIGDILIVPGGEMPAAPAQVAASQPASVPLGQSYFICPISLPCAVTQGLHWYNAIDFSHGKCGEPIYSAAAGEVLKVKLTSSVSSWAFYGAGNHITILHPNGVVTMYGHISSSFVEPGQQVSQGQLIALMGGQPGTPGAGQSTGCHLHFGVTGARNPFAQ